MTTSFSHPSFPSYTWHDALSLTVEGLGYRELASPFDRFPARACQGLDQEVWKRSRYSAGVSVRFVTDASVIAARWRLRFEREKLTHMAATSACGLDLYVRDGHRWRWIGLGPPGDQPETVCKIVSLTWEPATQSREFQLYLPLFNGVDILEIGVPAKAALAPGPARPAEQKPLCFYGTSIVHGACASRAGMTYPAILGRRLDRPVLNLGFAGYAHCEDEVARLLVELDPCAYVLDPLPNMTAESVCTRIEPFVRMLRQARPRTPIFLLEYPPHTAIQGLRHANHHRDRVRSSAVLREVYAQLVASGVGGLHCIPAAGRLGDDGDATVDGIHPTDLGFLRTADSLERALREVLARAEA